eukprot:scaffold3748_cov21-Tisochrysis_lutea.AAC.2
MYTTHTNTHATCILLAGQLVVEGAEAYAEGLEGGHGRLEQGRCRSNVRSAVSDEGPQLRETSCEG